MNNHNVEIELKESICKDCEHLDYWDGYFCDNINRPLNLKVIEEYRNIINVKECDDFETRKPREDCKTNKKICPFWCTNCDGRRS